MKESHEIPESPVSLIGPGFAFETEQFLSSIVESSDDAILSKDLNGIITSWNRGAERLFGYSVAEAVGRPVNILIPSDRQDEEPDILQRIRRGFRIDHYETIRRRKDGSMVEVSISVSPIRNKKGEIVGASKVTRDISDRKRADRTSHLLSSIVESSEDAIASKDLHGIITSWNASAERMFGYTADEIIGKPVTVLFPEDRLDEEPGVIRRIIAGQRVEHFETKRRRKDGTLIDVSLTVSPIRDESGKVIGASKILRDITGQKAAQRAKMLLSAIVESSDDAIASKDLDGIITSWNAGAEKLFGYKPDEVIGKPVTMLIPADHADEEPGILRRIRRGERIKNYHTVRRRKDGSLVDVSLTISPIKDENGNIIGASKIVRDITELIRGKEILEQTIAHRTGQLQETVRELEAFSYSIAHDMRAPLRSMNTYARIVLDEFQLLLPKEGQEYLRKIGVGATRLDMLITDVLNYSKLTRGEMELAPVNVAVLASEIVDSYAHLKESGATIEIESPMAEVLANRAALTQCLSNLLSNAVKFVPANRKPRVKVSAEERGDFVRISVRDNGIGISEEGQKRIFALFQRLNSPQEFEGTGIGLAIVRKAVQRMGGRFGVESKPNEGSCFWLELKAAE